MLKNGLSAHYFLNEMLDSYDISMDSPVEEAVGLVDTKCFPCLHGLLKAVGGFSPDLLYIIWLL